MREINWRHISGRHVEYKGKHYEVHWLDSPSPQVRAVWRSGSGAGWGGGHHIIKRRLRDGKLRDTIIELARERRASK